MSRVSTPYLNDGPITEVATRIRDLVRHNAGASEVLEREARYFEKHAKRTRYREFREKVLCRSDLRIATILDAL